MSSKGGTCGLLKNLDTCNETIDCERECCRDRYRCVGGHQSGNSDSVDANISRIGGRNRNDTTGAYQQLTCGQRGNTRCMSIADGVSVSAARVSNTTCNANLVLHRSGLSLSCREESVRHGSWRSDPREGSRETGVDISKCRSRTCYQSCA